MCFTQNASFSFGIFGLIASIYFYKRKHIFASIGIAYFSLMEFIQYFQYFFINKCDNSYNYWLTLLGYLHICFQPLFVNIWLLTFVEKELLSSHYVFLYMSIIAGILLFSRIFYVSNDEICDINNEPLCGKNTCTFSGQTHIAWNIRMRAAGKYWYSPSIALHFFMWVIPTIVTFKYRPIIALILTGPYMSLLFTSNIHEQPAIWCFFSVIQIIITYILLVK